MVNRKIPNCGPASDWMGKKTIFGEEKRDFSFILDRSPAERPRVIQHPAKTNKHSKSLRFCHPTNPICRISTATYGELYQALNNWTPQENDLLDGKFQDIEIDTIETEKEILKKCLLKDDNIVDMKIIKASISRDKNEMKIIIFDVKKQVFLLRGAFKKSSIKANKGGWHEKIKKTPSKNQLWYTDISTLLSTNEFWKELKVLFNEI